MYIVLVQMIDLWKIAPFRSIIRGTVGPRSFGSLTIGQMQQT